jgi:hypothetical protein
VKNIIVPDFEKEIKGKIELGFQPYGDLVVIIDKHQHPIYHQTMVKYE